MALLLGAGCAVVPRALWHAALLDKSLALAMRDVARLHAKYNSSADDLASKMVSVYQLRRAAASSMRAQVPSPPRHSRSRPRARQERARPPPPAPPMPRARPRQAADQSFHP